MKAIIALLRLVLVNNAMLTVFFRLEAVVNQMFERCFHDRQYTQAVGIAIETRRLDVLERAITSAVSLTLILILLRCLLATILSLSELHI